MGGPCVRRRRPKPEFIWAKVDHFLQPGANLLSTFGRCEVCGELFFSVDAGDAAAGIRCRAFRVFEGLDGRTSVAKISSVPGIGGNAPESANGHGNGVRFFASGTAGRSRYAACVGLVPKIFLMCSSGSTALFQRPRYHAGITERSWFLLG